MKVLVVGYGRWGRRLARVMREGKIGVVTGVCDRAFVRLEEARAVYPLAVSARDVEEALATDVYGLALVVTPPSTHLEVAMACVRAGVAVSVEKPFTTSETEATTLRAAAVERGVTLSTDYTFLYDSRIRRLKSRIKRDSVTYAAFISAEQMWEWCRMKVT